MTGAFSGKGATGFSVRKCDKTRSAGAGIVVGTGALFFWLAAYAFEPGRGFWARRAEA